jgi:hypothetical protein
VVELEDLGDDLVAGAAHHPAGFNRPGLQLGVRLGHDLDQRAHVHDREALLAQDRLEQGEGQLLADRSWRLERDLAAHARVDDEGPVEQVAEGADHRIDLRVLEVERDGFVDLRHRGHGQKCEQENQTLSQFP